MERRHREQEPEREEGRGGPAEGRRRGGAAAVPGALFQRADIAVRADRAALVERIVAEWGGVDRPAGRYATSTADPPLT